MYSRFFIKNLVRNSNKISSGLAFGMLSAVSGYALYKRYEPRERRIIAQYTSELNYSNASTVNCANKIDHGTLSHEIISISGKNYLKKGAKSKEKLLRELIVASVLNKLDPHSQPESLLYATKLEDTENAQFFTLSEMKPSSIDLEYFITQNNWKEKLEKKPLKGFEVALAKIALIAGQQDCKFANMIITEYEDHYQVGVIDFELTGTNLLSINSRKATSDIPKLITMIRDVQSSLDYELGCLVTNPIAKEFIEYALKYSMKEEEIINFYKTVENTDFITPAIECLEQIKARSNLVNKFDIVSWQQELNELQKAASNFCSQHQEAIEHSASSSYAQIS